MREKSFHFSLFMPFSALMNSSQPRGRVRGGGGGMRSVMQNLQLRFLQPHFVENFAPGAARLGEGVALSRWEMEMTRQTLKGR